jgi:hypothetical protein
VEFQGNKQLQTLRPSYHTHKTPIHSYRIWDVEKINKNKYKLVLKKEPLYVSHFMTVWNEIQKANKQSTCGFYLAHIFIHFSHSLSYSGCFAVALVSQSISLSLSLCFSLLYIQHTNYWQWKGIFNSLVSCSAQLFSNKEA